MDWKENFYKLFYDLNQETTIISIVSVVIALLSYGVKNINKKKTKKAVRWITNFLITLCVIAVCVVLVSYVFVSNKELVKVPKLIGSNVANARDTLKGVDISLDFRAMNVVEDEEIIRKQEPDPYTIVERNKTVILIWTTKDFNPTHSPESLDYAKLAEPIFNANGTPYNGSYKNVDYDDGATYTGEYKEGLPEGEGEYLMMNENKYIGTFHQGLPNGKGTYIWAVSGEYKGFSYEGAFKDGYRNGLGIMIWPDGGEYDGSWVDDARNGKGTMTFANGDEYNGSWVDDAINGKGVLTYADGVVHDGTWSYAKLNGFAIITETDGTFEVGTWFNDQRHGTFLYYDANGQFLREFQHESDLISSSPPFMDLSGFKSLEVLDE